MAPTDYCRYIIRVLSTHQRACRRVMTLEFEKASQMTESRTIFIGGLHGSGTSLLHRWLRYHPQISGMTTTGAPEDEGQHLQDVLPTGKSLGGMGCFGHHDGAHLTETSSLNCAATRTSLEASWGPHWNPSLTLRVEKSPPNLLRFRLLQELFPGAICVALLRHPLAVAYSTNGKRRITRFRPLTRLVEHWLHCHRVFEQDRHEIRHLVVLRYEHLIDDPETALAPLWDALGLDPVVAPEQLRKERDERHGIRWQRRLRRPPRPQSILRLEGQAQHFGYSLRDFGATEA